MVKKYTLLISSNQKGSVKTFCVSAAWVKASLFLFSVLGVLLAAFGVDYVGLLLGARESKKIHAEKSLLLAQFQRIEGKVNSLESSLERIRVTEAKLKSITDVEREDRVMNLSTDLNYKLKGHFAGTDLDREMRGSEEGQFKEDALFLKRPPLAVGSRELSVLKKENYASLSVRIDRAVATSKLREQSIADLYETLSERESLLRSTPSIKPARGWYTSHFGYRMDPFTGQSVMHYGLDIAAAPGTPVKAPADGVVSYVGYESGYGKLVAIDHGYGVKTRFAHNSRVFVEVGQKVRRWDVVAAVGSTGRSSGPHLHYEVRVHDVPVDPSNYVLND